jgi:hypothetical protein
VLDDMALRTSTRSAAIVRLANGSPQKASNLLSRNGRRKSRPGTDAFDALHPLMTPPDQPKRPIGFVTPSKDKGKKAAGARGTA